jgi:hypothetical protein
VIGFHFETKCTGWQIERFETWILWETRYSQTLTKARSPSPPGDTSRLSGATSTTSSTEIIVAVGTSCKWGLKEK